MSKVFSFPVDDFTGIRNVGISIDYVKICQIIKGDISFKLKISQNNKDVEEYILNIGSAPLGNFVDLNNVEISMSSITPISDETASENFHTNKLVIVRDNYNNAFICIVKQAVVDYPESNIIAYDLCGESEVDALKLCTCNRYVSNSEIAEVKTPEPNLLRQDIYLFKNDSCFLLFKDIYIADTEIEFSLQQGYVISQQSSTLAKFYLHICGRGDRRKVVCVEGIDSKYIKNKLVFYYVGRDNNRVDIYMVAKNLIYNYMYIDNSITPLYIGSEADLPQGATQIDMFYNVDTTPTNSSQIMTDHDYGKQCVSTDNKKPYYWFGNWYDAEGEIINIRKKGTTAQRPTPEKVGFMYIDETLGNKPIWYDGNSTTGWVDATGTPV